MVGVHGLLAPSVQLLRDSRPESRQRFLVELAVGPGAEQERQDRVSAALFDHQPVAPWRGLLGDLTHESHEFRDGLVMGRRPVTALDVSHRCDVDGEQGAGAGALEVVADRTEVLVEIEPRHPRLRACTQAPSRFGTMGESAGFAASLRQPPGPQTPGRRSKKASIIHRLVRCLKRSGGTRRGIRSIRTRPRRAG